MKTNSNVAYSQLNQLDILNQPNLVASKVKLISIATQAVTDKHTERLSRKAAVQQAINKTG